MELLYVSREGIGPELCHSSIKYSPTSSVLLSWCSLGGGRRMDLFSVCRRSSLSLLLTTCPWLTVHIRDWEEVLLTPPLAPFCIVCLYVNSCVFLNLHCVWGWCVFFFYLWCFSGVEEWGTLVLGQWSSDGRQCWLWLGLGMLNGGREGLFELGQQLQQQGEYQAALHCFLSCLLGLTHVQSFTSLPNCLHQVSQMRTGHICVLFSTFLCLTYTLWTCMYMHSDSVLSCICTTVQTHLHHFSSRASDIITQHSTQDMSNLDISNTNVKSDSTVHLVCVDSQSDHFHFSRTARLKCCHSVNLHTYCSFQLMSLLLCVNYILLVTRPKSEQITCSRGLQDPPIKAGLQFLFHPVAPEGMSLMSKHSLYSRTLERMAWCWPDQYRCEKSRITCFDNPWHHVHT